MSGVKSEIEAAERKARAAIAEIIPLLHELPEEALPPVAEHLEAALRAAREEAGKRRSSDGTE